MDAGPLLRPLLRAKGGGHRLKQLIAPASTPILATSYTRILDRCKEMCQELHIIKAIGLHSFRIGAATTAFNNGVDGVMVQRMGRWRSPVYAALYSRQSLHSYLHINRSLGLAETA